MNDLNHVYVFRRSSPAGRAAEFCVARKELVVAAFGGGGMFDAQALSRQFGYAVFKDDAAGTHYLGVWGARKCSRFRRLLRESLPGLNILREPPPGRMMMAATKQQF